MDKPMTFIEWCSSNGKIPYSLGLEGAYEAGQQSMQAKVEGLQDDISLILASHKRMSVGLLQQQKVISEHEKRRLQLATEKRVLIKERDELQKQLSEYIFVSETLDEMYVKEVQKSDELQKRVDAALKLIESWNEIAFDKTTHWTEGYEEGCYHCAAQLEQALKGEGCQ
ncbi:hypothetical protein [Acinetobacter baumannii]|uniref:hypothetical protein n=2 Tax=Acinetobacter baumannii TaxID=470 RepID=UPI00093B3AC2|nr:hypothetical protein [Acinetobacter baumannii]MBK6061788.1 hypothetical protein [Acinetobacter baumannii]MDF7878034.1 hypothetical protein [Acinetobacter baumannii]MDF7882611.1 hypothetical protein [Acinetobacter baumannii]MDF7885261.1 hypothetical protein [Acinetobacter baumannii]MDF7890143.1 hypothetical protein [Acinetobacter baumannii]